MSGVADGEVNYGNGFDEADNAVVMTTTTTITILTKITDRKTRSTIMVMLMPD